jgi:hypothetical protein
MLYINKKTGEVRQIIKEKDSSLFAVLPEYDGATGYYISKNELLRDWQKARNENKNG